MLRADILIIGLLFGYSVAENGFLGFFILFVRTNLKVPDLRASIAVANFQGVLSAFFSILMIYFGYFRAGGLSRVILYAYSTYIAGMLVLWLSTVSTTPYLIPALVLITIGQAGERCVVHFFGIDWEESTTFYPQSITPPGAVVETAGIMVGILRRSIPMARWPGPRSQLKPLLRPHSRPRPPMGGRLGPEDTDKDEEKKELWKKVQYFCVRLPGAAVGAFYVSTLSSDQTFMFTAVVMAAGYHLFFWFGPKSFYEPVNTIEEKNEKKFEEKHGKKHGATSRLDVLKEAIKTVLGEHKDGATSHLDVLVQAIKEVLDKEPKDAATLRLDKFMRAIIRAREEKKDETPSHLDVLMQAIIEVIEAKDTSLWDQIKQAISVSTRLFPLWLTFTFTCYLVSATGNTLFVAQLIYLGNGTQSFKAPIISTVYFILQFAIFAISLLCDWLIIKKCSRREKGKQYYWARLFRVGVGMFFSFLCCIVACLVEGRRMDSGSNSISIFWLVPQYFLFALMRGIGNEGLAGFLSDCVCESDQYHIKFTSSFAEIFGNIISIVLAFFVSPSGWIGRDVGSSHLYYYYRMLAFICLCSSLLFIIVVGAFKLRGKYPYRKAEQADDGFYGFLVWLLMDLRKRLSIDEFLCA